MARIRYIKPDFTADVDTSSVSIQARYLYMNLWCHMDRQGVCLGDERVIKRNVFPYDEKITHAQLANWVKELVDEGFLFRIEHGGKKYLYCPTLKRHQKFHKEEKVNFEVPADLLGASTLPAPTQHPTSTLLAPYSHPLSTLPTALVTENGNGELVTGTGTKTETEGSSESCEQDCGSVLDEFSQERVRAVLEEFKIPISRQKLWLETYPDGQWLGQEILRMLNWFADNPHKKPKSRHARFMNAWFSRGWERHRKTLSSSVPSPPQLVVNQDALWSEG